MDELSKVITNLIGQLPAAGETPEAGNLPEATANPLPAADSGGELPDLSGILGMLGSQQSPSQGERLQVLNALKPYLDARRREKIERACSLLDTAYTVRSMLGSLGGILHV